MSATTRVRRLAPGRPFNNPFETHGGLFYKLKNRTDLPSVPLPVQPKPFTGAPSQDMYSWPQSLDIVFLARGIVSLDDKLCCVIGFVEGPAAQFLATLQDVDSWEHFKQLWTAKCSLYSTDVEHRRHLHAIRQETEDVEQYITGSAKRLSLVVNPSEEEVLMVYLDGLDTKIQQHVYQEQVTTIADALRLTRAFYLAAATPFVKLQFHARCISREEKVAMLRRWGWVAQE